MGRARTLAVVAAVVLAVLALDQATKVAAVRWLKDDPVPHIFLGDLFRIQYAENTGAFLSLGSTLDPAMRFWVMTGLNSAILAALALFLLLAKPSGLLLPTALSLILSGGVGNLIDRIFRDGRVVDFMNMGVAAGGYELRTGIFNIADVAIMAGLALVLVGEFMGMRRREDKAAAGDGGGDSPEKQ